MHTISGRTWCFGDNISTDLMMPAAVANGRVPPEEARYHCMYADRPGWARQVTPGDLIVAGHNFGCGSSRPAPLSLKELGIPCVVVESVAGLFFRNAISLGLPVVECPGITSATREGDVLTVDLRGGTVTNHRTGARLGINPLPDLLLNILAAGGMLALLKAELKAQADDGSTTACSWLGACRHA